MEKILVSGCLLGQLVRYDGGSQQTNHPLLNKWQQQNRLISICPEVSGGLAVPRSPAELQAGGRVMTVDGMDVSQAFKAGAQQALKLAQQHQIKLAIFKARSPSCGNRQVYDGSFSGQLIDGEGVAAKMLRDAGIQVFNEQELEQANCFLLSQEL